MEIGMVRICLLYGKHFGFSLCKINNLFKGGETMSFFANFWARIVVIEKLILSDAWQYILPALKKIEQQGLDILVSEAVPMVKALETTMTGGTAKGAAALVAIGKDAAAKGIVAGQADLTLVRELAVQNLPGQIAGIKNALTAPIVIPPAVVITPTTTK
jgi:hypothetical protein